MTRVYLHEDLAQIQRYFPGARTVALRTPFDLTDRDVPAPHDALRDTFTEDSAADGPLPPTAHTRGLLWTH